MAILTSNIAQFTFAVAGLDQDLRVVRFEGSEGLSQLFRFHLELAVDDGELDFAAVVGKPGLLTMYGVQGERYVNGLVSRFEQAGDVGRFTTYYAELVPQLWLLAYRHRSRIFQRLSVPDIISQVLEEAGIASDQYRWVLQRSYEPREYCVQYRESELNFIARLLEEEGIFYFFQHTKDSHVLVMGDDPSAHAPVAEPATVIYHEPIGAVPTEEYVFEFRYAEEVRPGAVMLRDFDFKKPSLRLQADAQADKDAALEIYDYPGEYVTPEKGADLARVRLQEQQVPRKRGRGRSVCRRYIPGYRFTLDHHPRTAFNQEYVLVRVHHRAAQPQVREEWTTGEGSTYANDFECVPASVPFRPPRLTHRPVVKGSQTAIVVGPKGEEIYTDEHGRVKVLFHWDREGKGDENSSCWIRVSQGWAGAGWGAMYIPRIGQEVIVDFLEGDPDQPLITGRVYNGEHPPPYALPDEKTKSTLKSNSSKDGQGFNEIRFEDNKGQEQLFIHAERDLDCRIKNDRREWVGNDRHLVVKRDKRELVERDKHVLIQRDEVREIKRDHNLTIKGKEAVQIAGSHSLTVQGDVIEVFKMNHSEQVTMNYYLKGMNVVIEGMTGLTIKVGGSFITLNPGGVFISGPMVMINSGGAALSGTAGSAVPPAAPLEAEVADTAEPGRQTPYQQQRERWSPQELAALNAPWHRESESGEEEKKSWIEIELVDENDQPVPGERYRVTLPDGTIIAEGTLDEKGLKRIDGIDPGTCQITFPNLDKDAWKRI